MSYETVSKYDISVKGINAILNPPTIYLNERDFIVKYDINAD